MADIQQDVTAVKAAVKADAAAAESAVKTDAAQVKTDAKDIIARLDAWIGAHRKAGIAIAAALFAAAVAIIVHLV